MDWPVERARPASGGLRLFTFRGPCSSGGALLGALLAWFGSGGRGFFVGLAIGAGLILGDVADRQIAARGLAAPDALVRLGGRIRSGLGAILLGLGIFLAVSFGLTGLPIVLAGALIAVGSGALLLWKGVRS
jgi:hypothetical protein